MSEPPVVSDPLFFLDYDGTLAPIVDDPAQAVPHPQVPPVLRQLRTQHPLWIVTGRDLESLSNLLSIAIPAIGLHGAQQGVIGQSSEPRLPDDAVEALSDLQQRVPDEEGINVESKPPTFAVHYRHAHNPNDARKRLRAWVDTAPSFLDAIWGKKVVELRHTDHNKGRAVQDVTRDHPNHTPVYIGDDVTDEDAFRVLADYDAACTIKVGPEDTAAQYRLADVEAVVAYLRRYLPSKG